MKIRRGITLMALEQLAKIGDALVVISAVPPNKTLRAGYGDVERYLERSRSFR